MEAAIDTILTNQENLPDRSRNCSDVGKAQKATQHRVKYADRRPIGYTANLSPRNCPRLKPVKDTFSLK